MEVDQQSGAKLNEGEFKVYDRQLRLWGFEAQKRMKESKVLVVNLIGAVTELCRHLVLSGINLEIASETAIVDSTHAEGDFLFNSSTDCGKRKSDVIAEKLRLMNPFAIITTTDEALSTMIESGKYSAVVSGFDTFKESSDLNSLCRTKNIPFYTLNTSGLYGFFYCDVGQELTFTHHKKATDTDEQHTIKDSKTLQDWLTEFTSAKPFKWRPKALNKSDKYLLLAILSQQMKETEGASLADQLSKLILTKSLPSTLSTNPEFITLLGQFERTFNLDYNPTSSVIGALVSQEVAKVVTLRDFPSHGLAVYDSVTQKCIFQQD